MAAQGEVLGFEEYVRTRQDALLRSARRLVPDPVDAQDLLQTALVRTYGRWDGIADKSLADAYLRRVMINTRTEWWRARKLEEVPTEQLPDASVDDGSDQRADRALLMDVLKVLAPKQRSVVVLRHWEQMSTEETAAALGMSTGTVKSTLHRALARLRQELESRAQECEDLQLGERAVRAVRTGGGVRAAESGAPRVSREPADPRDRVRVRVPGPVQGSVRGSVQVQGTVRTRDRVVRQRQDGRGQERCAA
ncbi:SigE family RNA polymerase sigma factor [Streptomyces sp. NPDC058953]|uniref:SigE family RNA polymerase sigma factor n=1 Tax=unclassified Streptomyces TaxID=2593676 RepID=UPI003681548C